MNYYIAMDCNGNYDLAHHGILGQKWGVRRYQNKDGSLTEVGKKRYQKKIESAIDKRASKVVKELKKHHRHPENSNSEAIRTKLYEEVKNSKASNELEKALRNKEEFDMNMQKKYRAEEKMGYVYFDVYSSEEADKAHLLSEKVQKAYKDYGQEIYKIAEKKHSEILSAQLKDISVKDTKETREILEEVLKSRYGDDWWRWIR